jgi:hypothetical protein
MMNRNEDGSWDYDSLILIDFDLAAWGYRAWDIVYYFGKWTESPTLEEIEDFAQAYLEEFDNHGNQPITVDEFVKEIRLHQPFSLLQNMLFYDVILEGYMQPSHLTEYCDLMINYYNRPGKGMNIFTFTLYLSQIMNIFAI